MSPSSRRTTAVLAGLATAGLLLGGLSPGLTDRGGDGEGGSTEAPGAASGMTSALRPAVTPAAAQQAAAQQAADTLTAAERAIRAHDRAARGPQQPIPFSHRFHVTDLKIDCEYCHTDARGGAVAPMPPVSTCMGCHRFVGSGLDPIEELRGYANRGEPIPWERVYKVPEFVQFTHQPHLRNEIDCAECHGPVEEMDRVYKFTDLSMGWCLACHRQEPAPADVATNYRLVREFPPPEMPEGRQPVGLYPYGISSGYAAARAPTDCATCHY